MIEQSQTEAARRRGRGRLVVNLLALAGLIGMGVWIASERRPTGAASGVALDGPTARPSVSRVLRVATFNIHGAKGTDRKTDVGRVADLLRGVDLAGLNEVHGGSLGQENQAAQLGKRLQMPWLFAPAETRWGRDWFGNGLLCSLPVTSWMRIPMPTRGGVAGLRNVVLAQIQVDGQNVNVLVVHIHRMEDRVEQLRVALSLFLSLQPPSVILGDFNTPRGDSELSLFLARPDVMDAHGGNPKDTPARIDWIVSRGLTVRKAEIVPTNASDHPMLTAEFELPATPFKN